MDITKYQTTKDVTATETTAGTNLADTESASLCIFAVDACASSTICTICDSAVSAPTFVALTSICCLDSSSYNFITWFFIYRYAFSCNLAAVWITRAIAGLKSKSFLTDAELLFFMASSMYFPNSTKAIITADTSKYTSIAKYRTTECARG
ncbi:MAG TPA: hypothetical protein VFS97_00045 [Nitrososphaeraceae archaeon]|nr:hypothetical protein [Nitrososphaeraceae archaeon]